MAEPEADAFEEKALTWTGPGLASVSYLFADDPDHDTAHHRDPERFRGKASGKS
jgi:hypothetical protein